MKLSRQTRLLQDSPQVVIQLLSTKQPSLLAFPVQQSDVKQAKYVVNVKCTARIKTLARYSIESFKSPDHQPAKKGYEKQKNLRL